ncbi:phosphoribosylformylglycinamidine synthase [Schnuerera sp. xch1]|uniref:phosphoribosylformylglycinamidine synthase n=1 Tax=Schnuerera sp. xch1 TaxID=2874283 RepID=UPI001CC03748|nr:phosphoribosylformylglycinamidine synthase [Schnuerera sp. xch1]MBZ2175507.1 phosphoribosylformylglycinamidine synthase [Schnuerera sp. xch1]
MKRIIIEKKRNVNVEAKNLLKEFRNYLGIKGLEDVRVLNVYEVIGGSDEELDRITEDLLYEEPLDIVYEDVPPMEKDEKAFRVETNRGQYNQREDSAINIVSKYLGFEGVDIKHSKLIILKNISYEGFEKVKSYYINPTESKEIPLDYFSYEREVEAEGTVEVINRFTEMTESEVDNVRETFDLAMDMEDILYCQKYFSEEDRDPTVAELKIIDTYWSDHCRHTTFMTEITDIDIEEGKYKKVFERAIREYLLSREYVYKKERAISLMDLATINMKETEKKGLLNDKEESEEANAASIEVDVDVDGKNEKWLLMFKNETHNHPTEIEPFGGAATCLGGGIRDPLSGRAYVYQAMRITGSGNPNQQYEETLPGKLPQRRITQTAMEGYSSYGYQIGSASGYINEFYDEGFIAKRMELGALVAAAPKDWVIRETPEPTDLVLLIGGRTGRDGIGAAVGSSKEQKDDALQTAGAEVQKGNPSVERKIVRLFRNPEATKLIKKCNDFGAGGVAVAVGELADGLNIDLDKVILKYPGLKGWEIAISESQERMAVVISKDNLDKFMKLVEKEDLEGTVIAEVTDKNRIHMVWKGNVITDIKREFLNTNGIRKKTKVKLLEPEDEVYLAENPSHIKEESLREDFIKNISQLNTASQKGLIERFDNTVGSGTVLMQLGGKYQLTPQEGMVAKLPVLDGNTKTCSIMTCGYDPKLAKWSTFHGGYYAVIESVAKVVALGGDFRKIRLTFQEYFEKLGIDPSKWGKPFASLLGAFLVQKNLDIPSIGGKDSMSGSFEDINVPPSLFSFAVVTEDVDNIVSKEFKKIGSKVVVVNLNIDENGLIDFEELKKNYLKIKELIDNEKVLSSSTIKFGGIGRSIVEMSFGNRIGFKFNAEIIDRLYKPLYGSIILEIKEEEDLKTLLKDIDYTLVGTTMEDEQIEISDEIILLDELIEEWERPLKEIFPVEEDDVKVTDISYDKGEKIKRIKNVVKVKVLIPVFTGTHGEYDMALRFKKAGAKVETFVFNSLSEDSIKQSYMELAKKISQCQILGLANGYLLGNEPETGGKLLKIIFNNPILKDAINEHLRIQDGLVLGIGSGFHALLKLGLIENGKISGINESSPYVSYNTSGQFMSTIVDIKVVSNLSPWMSGMSVGDIYSAPIATNEGRVLVGGKDLIKAGQIATQFVGHNPTGSDLAIESLTSSDGRVLGTVTSIDRIEKDIYKNIDIKGTHNIFESGVKYFG